MMTIEKKVSASKIFTKAQQVNSRLSSAFGIDVNFRIDFTTLTCSIGTYVNGPRSSFIAEVSEDELVRCATNTGILGTGIAMADATHRELIMDAVSVCRQLHDLFMDDCKDVDVLAWN